MTSTAAVDAAIVLGLGCRERGGLVQLRLPVDRSTLVSEDVPAVVERRGLPLPLYCRLPNRSR